MKKLLTLLTLFAMTLSMTAQTQKFYTWKNGTYVEHDISEVDSVTFSTPAAIHIAVDLGLPSGTLWADRNVGAESPSDYGDYFAWGETEPKSYYHWITYKWCDVSYDTQTKYCTDNEYGLNGFIDNETTLDPEDDAATTNWGSDWCMPTQLQLLELRDNCTWTWTTQNGVNGYKVIGTNGNSIFLPAAGYRENGDLNNAGSNGYYFSSSLYEGSPDSAWGLYFKSIGHYQFDCYRYIGYTVRAVCAENYACILTPLTQRLCILC